MCFQKVLKACISRIRCSPNHGGVNRTITRYEPVFTELSRTMNRCNKKMDELAAGTMKNFFKNETSAQSIEDQKDMTTTQDITMPDRSSSSDIAATQGVHYTEEIDTVARVSCLPNFFSHRSMAAPTSRDRGLFTGFGSFSSSSSSGEQRHHNSSFRSISSVRSTQTVASYPGRPSCVIRPLDERLLRRRCDRIFK